MMIRITFSILILVSLLVPPLVLAGCASDDTKPPVISSVTCEGVSGDSAEITWITNEAAIGQVEYGTNTDYG